ncbi:MAG TPA: hypothetical protein VN316_01215 [candidate division Zixibacteria bacterium]|nr:hypothetical protein [candidate division Zixibacteria bacterium]
MTEIQVSLCDQNYMVYFPGQPIILEKDSEKECKKSFGLASREERVALLKAGFTGKDIESEYIRRNRIVIIGINWQDLRSN